MLPPSFFEMGNVRDIIKESGIPQYELIERLKLSKPTFYSYVKLYENGGKIPRERYDIIFHQLFDDTSITGQIFLKRVQWAESMLERDSRFGIDKLQPDDADYAFRTLYLLVKDMELKDREKSIYIFINSLLTGYRNQEFFVHLTRYFSVIGGAIDISEIMETDKPYFANFYKCFRDMKENPLGYNEGDFVDFVKRCSELKKERTEKAEREKERLTEAILMVHSENESLGIEMNEKDFMQAVQDRLKETV